MLKTPTLWKAEYRVNTAVDNSQFAGTAVGLPDGGYFIAWVDGSGTYANDPTIIGQRASATGGRVGFEVEIGAFDTGIHNEPSIALLTNGRIAVAYSHFLGGNIDIHVATSNASYTGFTSVLIDDGASNRDRPAITELAGGRFAVAYEAQYSASDVDTVGRIGGSSAPLLVYGDDLKLIDRPETATVSNGSFVVVYEDESDFMGIQQYDIRYSIRTVTGAVVSANIVSGAAGNESEQYPDVAALKNGGFAVAWVDQYGYEPGATIHASVLSNTGAVVAADIAVNAPGSNPDTTAVVGLADGGFLVLWNDYDHEYVAAQRLSAKGAKVGTSFVASKGVSFNFSAALLSDGRVVITSTHDSDVFASIWDPRGKTIAGTSHDDLLTSRLDGATVRGLKGADQLLGYGGKDKLVGGGGDDVLTGGKGADKLNGGGGADAMHAGKGHASDVFVFTSKHDSGHGDKPGGWDHLFDFHAGGKHGDRIDLSGIDADKHAKHDQDFRFVDHFSKASGGEPDGEVTAQDAGKNVKVLVDVNGDKDADMIVLVMKVGHLHQGDFIL